MADAIVEALVDESGVLAAGPRILRTVSGEELDLPFVGTLPTATYRSEGAAATQSTPVIGQAVLNAWNISGWVTASDAFLRDATGSAESIIGTMCGQSLGVKLATELASGDGAPGHMVGYFDNAVAGKTTASSTNFTMDECLQLRGSLKPAARKGAKWVVSDAAHQILILMKDDNASYVVQPSTQAGFPDRLWGDELHVCAYGPAVTSGLKPIVYGRPDRAFFVRFVGPIEVQRSANVGLTEYTSWLSVFRFQIIADSVFVDTAAAKSLLMK
jgi:HK97 family phage major capsid protein